MTEIRQIAAVRQENREFLKHFSASADLSYAIMGYFNTDLMKFDEFWLLCKESHHIESKSEFVNSLGKRIGTYLKVNQVLSDPIATNICRMQKEKNLWITSGEVTVGLGESTGSIVPILAFPTGAFDDAHSRQAVFKMGLTYVVQAMNRTLFVNSDWHEGIYKTAMPLLSMEFVVVNKRGEITHDARSDGAGAGMLPDLKSTGSEPAPLMNGAGGMDLQNAVAAAVAPEGKTTLVPIVSADDTPRLVLVTPLENSDPGHALVIYEGEQADQTWLLDQLFGIYRLTPSEKHVARGIVLGQTVSEIAVEAAWSVATVRSYVKQVLSKMGLHRQSELIQLYHSSKLPIIQRPGWQLAASPAS